jgi:15-cis-phytoene synthase
VSTPASQRITRKSASNLALAFVLLPRDKRASMSALYAFCRQVDDVADETGLPIEQRRSELAAWREDIRQACSGGRPRFPVNQELQPAIAQYHLPFALFDELLCGVEMDLDIQRYEDYEQLDLYCYRVASVVGLLSIEIFGYRDPACRDYALALGKALQLTNILRDVRTDAERGRIYLPLEELRRFGVTPAEILGFHYSDRYHALARSVADRARRFYQTASRALPEADRQAMVAAELMGTVYWHLWRRLDDQGFNVFASPHIRLGKPYKLRLILRTWLRWALHSKAPNYGSE